MAIRLSDLAERLGARLLGDPDRSLTGARALHQAEPHHLSIIQHPRELRRTPLQRIRAGALLCAVDFAADHAHEVDTSLLVLEDPYQGLVAALALLCPEKNTLSGVHPLASIDDEAELAEDVYVGPFAVVGKAKIARGCRIMAHCFVDDDVAIDCDTQLAPGCVILGGSRIGAGVRLQPGVVVGADGFGYAPSGTKNIKVPQVGGVQIENEVEIGANSCVDRGALSDTRVGAGSKIDDLVLVGHGAEVGEDVVLVGQVGLAGGAQIGDRSVFAGQAGVAPFVRVGTDARVGARGGVTRDMPARAAWSGMPAIPHRDWLQSSVRFRQLERLHQRCQHLENELGALKSLVAALSSGDNRDNSQHEGVEFEPDTDTDPATPETQARRG